MFLFNITSQEKIFAEQPLKLIMKKPFIFNFDRQNKSLFQNRGSANLEKDSPSIPMTDPKDKNFNNSTKFHTEQDDLRNVLTDKEEKKPILEPKMYGSQDTDFEP